MPGLFQQIQAGTLWDFHGGVHPPGRKEQTNQKPVAVMSLPDRLYIPLRQHIGVAGRLIVQQGQHVLKGQPLTQADNSMAVPVHAPTSGTILDIRPHASAHPSALPELTLVLAPDGQDTWREREPLQLINCDKQTLLNRIQDSGIAGMGGAGFPTHLKSGVAQPVDYLIINAVECEPYITADDLLMQEGATTIVKGIDILCQLLNPKAVLIGIEDDKPIAAAAMMAACSQRENYFVRTVPTKYPSGGEKQLIQLLTSKEVPNGRRPIDIGIVMQNVGTAFAIAQAVLDDQPLISRIVTVAGESLSQPQNVLALIGTPVSALLDSCGFSAGPQQRVIMGGPMMGFTLPDLTIPVVKTTNCILAPTLQELPLANAETDCIRCSACADACPASLLPQQLFWYSKAKDFDKLKEYNLADCIECGACAYVCPSEIPLVQYYRVAKADIREQQREALKAEQAKARFEARNERLEREKLERQKRNEELAAARRQQQAATGANSAVADALARIKAKQSTAQSADNSVDDSSAEVSQTDIQALREQKKQQARQYQQQKQQALDTASPEPLHTEKAEQPATDSKDKSAAVAAALARAKARKQAQTANDITSQQPAEPPVNDTKPSEAEDPRKAAVAAALARAKAKKQVPAQSDTNSSEPAAAAKPDAADNADDPRKAAVAAALARAKAKKQAQAESDKQPAESADAGTTSQDSAPQVNEPATEDPRKAAVAAALARAKARKQANSENS